MLKHLSLAILALLAALPARANTAGCGGNADTYAEVVERRPGHRSRGPVMSVPETLCADLIERRSGQIESLHVTVGEPALGQPAPRRRDAR